MSNMLKYGFCLFLSFVGLTACAASVCGQVKKIEEKEFLAVRQKALDKLNEKPYRTTSTRSTQISVGSKDLVVGKIVSEFEPPNKNHFYISEKRVSTDTNETVSEIILIGGKSYRRFGNGKWTVSDKPSGSMIEVVPQKFNETIEHFYLGETVVDGQKADAYEVRTSQNAETISVKPVARHWFGKNNLWIKSETTYELWDTATNTLKNVRKLIEFYETDLSIKIEEPKTD